MDKGRKKRYEDPIIEELVLDVTDYASVMRGEQEAKESKGPEHTP